MTKIFLIFTVLILCSTKVRPQERVSANIGLGYYIINSENSTDIMNRKKFRFYLLYDLGYQTKKLFGFDLMIEYSYQEVTEKNVVRFILASDQGPNFPGPEVDGDMTLLSHNFDFDYLFNFNKYFSCGIGPSFIIVNRILNIPSFLYDKLVSTGLGVNGYGELSLPLNEGKQYFFLDSKLKLRYTHSIWFDRNGRNLDHYHQDYFTVQILVGAGYAF